jgi:hypothetical protein
MDLRMADFSSSSSGWSWIPIVIVAVALPVVGSYVVRQMRKIRGPVLGGTAEVLSLRQFGSVAVNGPSRMICRIRLSVNVPGVEPYTVAIWRNIPPWQLDGLRPGRTVTVEVSEKDPKKLQLRSSGPPTGGLLPPNAAQQAEAYRQADGAGQVLSAAALLASGQRVPAALKSFAATGTTPRSLGRTAGRPDLVDAPHYILEVELHFPNLAPITARAVQPVPLTHVSSLAIGLPLTCAVDPADPSHRFVVDWDAPSGGQSRG